MALHPAEKIAARYTKWYKLYQKGMSPEEVLYRAGDANKYRERDFWRMVHVVDYLQSHMAARVHRAIDNPPPWQGTDEELRQILSTIIRNPAAIPTYFGLAKSSPEALEIVTRASAIKKTMPVVQRRGIRFTRKRRISDEAIKTAINNFDGFDNRHDLAIRLGFYSWGELSSRISKNKELLALAIKKGLRSADGSRIYSKISQRCRRMVKDYEMGMTYSELAKKYNITYIGAQRAIRRGKRALRLCK